MLHFHKTNEIIGNFFRGPSIYASYQVSLHLAEWFQRRRLKCEKLMNARRQVMAKAKKKHVYV
jgi:hypothetical protein